MPTYHNIKEGRINPTRGCKIAYVDFSKAPSHARLIM
jgi:hypothetical protein